MCIHARGGGFKSAVFDDAGSKKLNEHFSITSCSKDHQIALHLLIFSNSTLFKIFTSWRCTCWVGRVQFEFLISVRDFKGESGCNIVVQPTDKNCFVYVLSGKRREKRRESLYFILKIRFLSIFPATAWWKLQPLFNPCHFYISERNFTPRLCTDEKHQSLFSLQHGNVFASIWFWSILKLN